MSTPRPIPVPASARRAPTSTPSSHQPILPFEIIRRIIHHRLALPPSFPAAPSSSAPIDGTWDICAGQSGQRAHKEREREREEVMRDALGMMLVCKAWKVGCAGGGGIEEPAGLVGLIGLIERGEMAELTLCTARSH